MWFYSNVSLVVNRLQRIACANCFQRRNGPVINRAHWSGVGLQGLFKYLVYKNIYRIGPSKSETKFAANVTSTVMVMIVANLRSDAEDMVKVFGQSRACMVNFIIC